MWVAFVVGVIIVAVVVVAIGVGGSRGNTLYKGGGTTYDVGTHEVWGEDLGEGVQGLHIPVWGCGVVLS